MEGTQFFSFNIRTLTTLCFFMNKLHSIGVYLRYMVGGLKGQKRDREKINRDTEPL